MTRFDAADSAERQLLYADAVRAHRQRASPFLTIEVEPTDGVENIDEPAPWVQFSDGVVNLDCTDAELVRLKDLLGQFPAFKITEIARPEDVEGTNVRISAKADEKRIAEFLERAFREVYDLEEDYRVWVAEV